MATLFARNGNLGGKAGSQMASPLHCDSLEAGQNVHALKVRFISILDVCVGVHPVKKLEDYLVRISPPSERRLLVAPQGTSGFKKLGTKLIVRFLSACIMQGSTTSGTTSLGGG